MPVRSNRGRCMTLVRPGLQPRQGYGARDGAQYGGNYGALPSGGQGAYGGGQGQSYGGYGYGNYGQQNGQQGGYGKLN